MFKIDRSSVEYIDTNKSIVVIRENEQAKNTETDFTPAEYKPQTVSPAGTPEEIIKEARIKADMIIQKGINKINQIKQEAWQEGYTKGSCEVKEKYEALCRENSAALRKALEEVAKAQQEVIGELEDCILQLSLEIAEKIVNIQLEKNDNIFVGLIKKAVLQLNPKEKFTIRLNQIEYEKYFSDGSEWLSDELQSPPFAALKDSAIAPGGCMLECSEGVIKAGIDTQLEKIAVSLAENQNNEDL